MTKQKLTQAIPLIVAVFALCIGYIFSHPMVFNLCVNSYQFKNYISCSDDSIQTFGFPLLVFSYWFLSFCIALFFAPARLFRSWLKFATWTLPLAFVWIALTPVSWTGLGIDFFPYYRINAAHDAGVAFVIASIVFLVWKYFKKSRETRIS